MGSLGDFGRVATDRVCNYIGQTICSSLSRFGSVVLSQPPHVIALATIAAIGLTIAVQIGSTREERGQPTATAAVSTQTIPQLKSDGDVALKGKNTELLHPLPFSSAYLNNNEYETFKTQIIDFNSIPDVARNGKNVVTIGINGAGPTGLMSAIQTFKQGANVVLAEKRAGYTRNHTIQIEAQYYTEFKRLIGEQNFDSLEKHGYLKLKWVGTSPLLLIRMREFEMALAAVAEKYAKTNEDQFKIMYGHEFARSMEAEGVELKPINRKEVILTHFDWIIGADSLFSVIRDIAGISFNKISGDNYGMSVIFEGPPPSEKLWSEMRVQKGYDFARDFIRIGGIEKSFNFSEAVFKQHNDAKLHRLGYDQFLEVQAEKREQWAIDMAKSQLVAMGYEAEWVTNLKAISGAHNYYNVFSTISYQSSVYAKVKRIGENSTLYFLAGDAANTVHFMYTGAGTNNGLAAAIQLGQEVEKLKMGESFESIASDYDTFIQENVVGALRNQ